MQYMTIRSRIRKMRITSICRRACGPALVLLIVTSATSWLFAFLGDFHGGTFYHPELGSVSCSSICGPFDIKYSIHPKRQQLFCTRNCGREARKHYSAIALKDGNNTGHVVNQMDRNSANHRQPRETGTEIVKNQGGSKAEPPALSVVTIILIIAFFIVFLVIAIALFKHFLLLKKILGIINGHPEANGLLNVNGQVSVSRVADDKEPIRPGISDNEQQNELQNNEGKQNESDLNNDGKQIKSGQRSDRGEPVLQETREPGNSNETVPKRLSGSDLGCYGHMLRALNKR